VRAPEPEHPIDGPLLELGRPAEVLDRCGVEHLLAGDRSIAPGRRGAERRTEDSDGVVRREVADLDRLAAASRD
jgi:hypothetical protein